MPIYSRCRQFGSDNCNGAANIIRKAIQRGLGRGLQALEMNSRVSPSAFPHERLNQEVATTLSILSSVSLDRVSRGVLTCPQRLILWSVNGNVERCVCATLSKHLLRIPCAECQGSSQRME
jgi:hypothetical protein